MIRGTVAYERQKLLAAAYQGERSVDRLGAELNLDGILSLRGGLGRALREIRETRSPKNNKINCWVFDSSAMSSRAAGFNGMV